MYMYLQDPHPFQKHESINESQTKAIISIIFFVNFGHSLGQLGFKVYINKIRQLYMDLESSAIHLYKDLLN